MRTARRNHLANVPTAILSRWRDQTRPGTETAATIARELDGRAGERDEQITERAAARVLGIDRDTMHRIGDAGLVRPIREHRGQYQFSRREIERWRAWTDQEGTADAQ